MYFSQFYKIIILMNQQKCQKTSIPIPFRRYGRIETKNRTILNKHDKAHAAEGRRVMKTVSYRYFSDSKHRPKKIFLSL